MTKHFLHPMMAVCAVIGLCAAAPVARGSVFSDNFDSDPQGLDSVPAGWKVTGGTVDVIGTGFFDLQPGNGNYIDLDGSVNSAGLMETLATFGPGTYTLTFDLAGNLRGNGPEIVTFGLGDYANVIVRNDTDPFTPATYTFTTTIAGSLFFHDASNDNIGALLDNVDLQSVPEPATLTIWGLGALGCAVAAYRRKKQAV